MSADFFVFVITIQLFTFRLNRSTIMALPPIIVAASIGACTELLIAVINKKLSKKDKEKIEKLLLKFQKVQDENEKLKMRVKN